jgi:site-specific recombinase XerD
MAAIRDPGSVGVATRVLAIPVERTDKRLLGYLTRQEMEALLGAHELSQWTGRRDYALLLTLYNTGARVSEMTGLQKTQVHFGTKTFVQFKSKGRKERAVPLWSSTSRTLRTWCEELDSDPRYHASTAFPNARGTALRSRDGVDYILQHAAERGVTACPSLANKHVTPHLIDTQSGMHLLQAGVDITVIALWLGHESTQTTHGYIEAHLALKEQALSKVAPAGQKTKRFRADDDLLRFLSSL